ncbi:MAG TPA: NAD-dependent epimerase, partial [Polyangiaceae bacterium]|nr:NAD-dependent epimerase [Polyangiaceae bacterium]
VHILGTVHNAPSNFLRLNPIMTVMGFDPMAQIVHQADVVHAIELALKPGVRGIFNIAGPEPVPLSRVIKILGRQKVSVPYSLARIVLRRLWTLRLTTFPPPELDYIRYVCMVDDRRARLVLGFEPRKSLEDTVRAVDEGRW